MRSWAAAEGPATSAAREAFGALYAACGLTAPAVLVFGAERGYRRAVRAAAIQDTPSGNLLFIFDPYKISLAIGIGAGLLLVEEAVLACFGVPLWAAWLSVPGIAVSAAGWASQAAWTRRQGDFRALLRVARRGFGLGPTPLAMLSMLSSATGIRVGADLGETGPGRIRLVDACVRLGARAVLAPSRLALANHPVGAASAGGPRLTALASAAAASAEEAVLMDGLVLALVPKGAKTAPPATAPALAIPGLDAFEHLMSLVFPPGDPTTVSARAELRLMPSAAEAALRGIGLDRAVAALGALPASEDGSGLLYRLSPALCAARVEDKVTGPDGSPLVHWIFVPPHMVTAREAVAWSFGLSEPDYDPTSEA